MNELSRSIVAHREITFADAAGTKYRFTVKGGLVTLHTKDPISDSFRKVLCMDEMEFAEMFREAADYAMRNRAVESGAVCEG
jgi:hypothetical protein